MPRSSPTSLQSSYGRSASSAESASASRRTQNEIHQPVQRHRGRKRRLGRAGMGARRFQRDRPLPVDRPGAQVSGRPEPGRHHANDDENREEPRKSNGSAIAARSIWSSGEAPASRSRSRGRGRDWMEQAASCGSTFEQYAKYVLDGFFGKTSRERSRARVGRTSDACSTPWETSGTAWRGGYLTRSSSESPRDAAVCSLSDVLEPNPPSKYSLSPEACRGILRRAERRGRALPPDLEEALTEAAS